MKTPTYHAPSSDIQVRCTECRSSRNRKHGKYTRKGFHVGKEKTAVPVPVQRYLCLNTDCPRRTFSVLPPLVLRYSRFFWPSLLVIIEALDTGSSAYYLARYIFGVGHRVIGRAVAMVGDMVSWIAKLYRELTDGLPTKSLSLMVKIIIAKSGRIELGDRWYRHRYPLRFM